MSGRLVAVTVMLAALGFLMLAKATAPAYHPQPPPDFCDGPLKYAEVCSPWWFTP